MKTALISGITGQDGSYLAELLLEKDYKVHGIVRRQSVESNHLERIEHIKDDITLHTGDLLDESGIFSIVKQLQPDELYNLAAQSDVGISSNTPIYTTRVNAVSVVCMLEAIRQNAPKCKFYQASSSEMFGNNIDDDGFQRETTQMGPVSPYSCAKLFAYNIVKHYRSAYGLFTCNGILMNHESPRRGDNFVTQKIVKAAKAIKDGTQEKLYLGNLDACRDWSHAKDMVRGMYLIMQHHNPNDFLLASGESHSVREFCEIVFAKLGLDYKDYVEIDPKFFRPQELKFLRGDSSRARTELGWEPEYSFDDLVEDMLK